ncbi:MAG: DUF1631 family protein [Usitatibacter sp.]
MKRQTGNHGNRREAAKAEPSPITALRDMLAAAFAADIAAVTPEVCEMLRSATQSEANAAKRNALRNSLVVLARQSAELSLSVIEQVRGRFDEKLAPGGSDAFASTVPFSLDHLTLVDDASLQVQLALDQCAARLREQCATEVFQLTARVADMLGKEALPEDANPILPRIFARSLLEAIAKLGLDDAAKLLVFKAYGPALLHIAPDLYRHANSLLADVGVLPQFNARYSAPSVMCSAVTSPTARAPAPAADESALAKLLERLLAGELKPAPGAAAQVEGRVL